MILFGLPFVQASENVCVIQANDGLFFPLGSIPYGITAGSTQIHFRATKHDGSVFDYLEMQNTLNYIRLTGSYRTV